MKKNRFLRKDGKEEQDILGYLQGLMEDNDSLRVENSELQTKVERLQKQLDEAEVREESKRLKNVKLQEMVKQREAEVYMFRMNYSQANAELDSLKKFMQASEFLRQYSASKEPEVNKRTDEATKKKVESLEKKIQTLRDKLGNESVPLSTLVDRLKTYVEEVGIAEAHNLFLHLNVVLNSVPAWANSVPELMKFFREYNKKQAQSKMLVEGDYVVSKNVEHEVNGVARGAVGINIKK